MTAVKIVKSELVFTPHRVQELDPPSRVSMLKTLSQFAAFQSTILVTPFADWPASRKLQCHTRAITKL